MANFCSNCGKALAHDATFCPNCSSPVTSMTSTTSETTKSSLPLLTPISANNHQKNNKLLVIAGYTLAGIIGFFAFIFLVTSIYAYNNYNEIFESSELSIGNISLEQSSSTGINTSGVKVIEKNGIITHLVAESPNVSTKRGLHIGSTEADMINEYGSDYNIKNLGELKIYEYRFYTSAGTRGILVFTVNTSSRTIVEMSTRLLKNN